jgi:hypothetical protein
VAVLLAATGCDKLRNIPGFEPAPVVPPRAPEPVAMGPWLIDPLPGRVTVAWTTDQPAVGRVWYGTRETDRLATEEGPPTSDHRVTLASLQPATQYRYRVEGGPETAWFTSAPDPGAEGPIQVLVYGDNRSNNGDHALVARAAAAERPQLVLHTGDMVANAHEEPLWRAWFHEEHDLLAHAPIVPTLGNHEITDTGGAYSRHFQHRGMPAYWSLDYGPVHIAVLDSFEVAAGATPRQGAMSDAQRAWLEEDLRRVPADRHVWLLVHQGPYAHPLVQRPGHGGSEVVKAAIDAARKVHPVEAVLAGHEHFYERGEIDALPYFVFGAGGAPFDDPDPAAPGVKAAAKALSYATIEVCGCHTRGVVKDVSGKVLDAFKLSDCAKPCAVSSLLPVAAASTAPAPPADPGQDEDRSQRRRRRTRRRGSLDGGAEPAQNQVR